MDKIVAQFYKNGNLIKNADDFLINSEDYMNSSFIKHKEFISESANKNLNGTFKICYNNGSIKVEGNYVNNQLIGNLKTYYSNGNIKEISFYQNGKLNGKYELYSIKGVKLIEESYKENLKNGVSLLFDKTGVFIERSYWEDGEITSKTELFPNRLPSYEIQYYCSREYHIEKEFYSNGLIKSIDFFKNYENIASEKYHENGTLKSKSGLISNSELESFNEEIKSDIEKQKNIEDYNNETCW